MKTELITAYYFINKITGVTRQVDAIDEKIGVKFTFGKYSQTKIKLMSIQLLNFLKKQILLLWKHLFFQE